MTILTIDGTGGDDTIVINATGTDSGSYSINGGPAVAFSGVTQVVVGGGAGNDTFTIVNPDGSLFAPTGGIRYDGGNQPADTLEVLGGTSDQFIYTAGATHDSGTLVHTGAAGTQTIDFAGIAPITDTTIATTFTINGTAGADSISITDGGLVGGVQTTQVASSTFESVRFANKGTVTIDGHGGGDRVSFNNPNPAAGLTTLNLTGVDGVTETGALKVANLSIAASGDVRLTTAGNQVGTLAASVGGGFAFTDSSPLAVGSVGGTTGITAANHAVTLSADNLDVQQQINAGTGTVTLQPLSAGRAIDLGGADTAAHLGLTDTELDQVTAGILRVGSSASGSISITHFVSPAGTSQLELTTGANIQDNNIGGADVTVARLAMTAGTGITAASSATIPGVFTAVSNLEAQTNTGGIAIVNASGGTLTLGGVTSALTGLKVATSGDISVANILAGTGTIALADADGSVVSASGDVAIGADRVAIGSTAAITAASGHSVTIQPTSAGWAVDLGSTTDAAANTLELSDAELDRVSAPTLRIGDTFFTGGLTVSNQITSDGHYGTLALRTGGAIVDGTAGEQTDIAVDNVALQAATGIGATGNLDLAVSTLAFNNVTSGGVDLTNATALTIGAVDGLASSSNGGGFVQVLDAAPITAAASVTATDYVFLFAPDTSASGNNDVTVLSGATVQSTTSYVSLTAGDNVVMQPGSTVQAATEAAFNVDSLSADPGVGGTDSLNGTIIGFAVISGNVDSDTLIGTPLDDELNGFTGADTMAGGTGNDIYQVDNGGDVVTENPGAGTDLVISTINYPLPANVENLILQGGADLQGFGNALPNSLQGNTGNNLLDGGAGADGMTGRAGNDTYFVDNSGDTITEAANEGNDTVFASVSFTLFANVENLILQGGADLQGHGNSLANVIYGNTGNNLIDGAGGIDLMVGGAGDDTYLVDDPSDSAFEVAGEGNDVVLTTANYGLAANVETLVMQGSADLQGYGSNQANVLYGNAGNNLLNGAGGIDLMVGGAGNDTYFVDDPSDSCFEVAGEGNDAVFAFCTYGLAADVETLVMQGSGDFQGYGSNQANTLYGNAGNNLLNGAGGADTMIGGAGNDTYFVDNGGDVVFENPGEGTDAVFATISYGLSANVEALVLQGGGNLSGTGNPLANSLFGNTGDNTLDGGAGADVLTGNAGNDTFVFHALEANGDTIVDFAGNGAAAGDSLNFVGYGAGATFTQNDAIHWQVNYNSGASHEVITFMNGAAIHPSDVVFT
jgi:trimeric autotransporter adhesin